jgi:hypothetical protein
VRRTARRLVVLIGAAVLLVMALAAGPAAAVTGAMTMPGGRGTGFVPLNGLPAGGSRFLIAVLSAVVIAVIVGTAIALDRRDRGRLAVAEGPAESAGHVCDDVVCELHASRPEVEERKAA